MPRRASVCVADTTGVLPFAMRGTNYLVETPAGVLYTIYIDSNSDLVYAKSTDGGLTWGDTVGLFTGTVTQFAVWYDRWSGISGDLIHYVYVESATNDDVVYRTINAASADALSTETVVTALTSATNAGGGTLSLTRSRGGIVYCRSCVDAGAEGGFAHLVNANVPNGAWASRTIDEAVADNDQIILMPGFAADSDDIIAVFLDASANTITKKLFDASANTWSESAMLSHTETLPEVTGRDFACVPDLTNSRIFCVAWTQADLANADLTCWILTDSTTTQVTDVITNSTDDQGCAALAIDANGHLYCAYIGADGGAQTFPTAVSAHYRVSTDAGTTWGAEQSLDTPSGKSITSLVCTPVMVTKPFGVLYTTNPEGAKQLRYTATVAQPGVNGNVGI